MRRLHGISGSPSAREMHRFLFAQAMEISQDVAVIVDLEGRFTYVNSAVRSVLGYRPEEMMGRFLWDILVDMDQIGRIMEATLDYGQWEGEVTCRRRETTLVPIRLRTVLVQSKEGEALGIVGMAWDLTAQKEMEAQLLRSERQRLVGEMAGGVAHNFNNALTTILGYAQVLSSEEGHNQEVRDAAGIILDAARRASDLADRIQRAVAGSPEGDLVPVLLNEAVECCIAATRPRWSDLAASEGRHIEVDTALHAVRPVRGRVSELDEILTNLVFNAVDAMPEGGQIQIRTWDEGEWGCLSVSDTGIGMDSETQRRLGEPFFTTKGDNGHGLGLAVCYRLVARIGGRIEVESAPKEGTTFVVRLLATHAAEPDPVPENPLDMPTCRMLVIEDDAGIRLLLEQALSECDLQMAESGEAGLEIFAEGRWDVVLVDFTMPGMNGVAVATEIQKTHPDVPVVLMTGWREPPEGASKLFRAVLTKPFSPSDLRGCVAKILESKHATD